MSVLATGTKTILDLTDGGSLTAYLTTNQPQVQIFNGNTNTYSPDWTSSNVVITPVIYMNNTSVSLTDSALSITWKRREGNGTPTSLTSGESVSNNVLTVNQNKLSSVTSGILSYIIEVTYTVMTGVTVTAKEEISFTLTTSGINSHSVNISGDQVFKTSGEGASQTTTPASITLTATPQNVTVSKWQYYNSTTSTWTDYPTSTDNPTITGNTLVVKPGHSVFYNDVAKIRVTTSDVNISDTTSIYKIANSESFAVISLYQRSASVPTAPTGSCSYDFSTDTLSGATLGNWTRSMPSGNGNPVWMIMAVARSNTGTDTITPGEWTTPQQIEAVNQATVNLYKRSASAPSKSSFTDMTYTFATGEITSSQIPSGWSQTVPAEDSNHYPCYVTSAVAVGAGTTATIETNDWSDVVKFNGDNAQIAFLSNENISFAGNASGNVAEVAKFCNVIGYNGVTKTSPVVGTPTGMPPGMQVVVGSATAPSNPSSGQVWYDISGSTPVLKKRSGSTWSTVASGTAIPSGEVGLAIYVANNSNLGGSGEQSGTINIPVTNPVNTTLQIRWSKVNTGIHGVNVATVYLYQRASEAPTVPSGDCEYNFSTGVLTGSTLGQWSQSIPSSTDPCYVTLATASSESSTDTIGTNEWTTPVVLVANGSKGTNGYNQATIYLYQRSSTAPSAPSSGQTYTFSSGSLSSVPTGWSTSVPATDGNPCYVTTAAAISRSSTATISGWSTPTKLVQDGENGLNAKLITVTGDQVFKVDASGTVSPSNIVLTAEVQNETFAKWQYYRWDTTSSQWVWTDYPTGTITNSTLTVNATDAIWNDDASTIRGINSDASVYDTITLYKVRDGTNTPMAYLTNENITFAANQDGKVGGQTKYIRVYGYEGATPVKPTLGTISGTPSGMTITAGTTSGAYVPLTLSITADSTLGGAGEQNGTINIPVTSPLSITLVLRWSKVNSGSDGYVLTVYAPDGNVFTNGEVEGKASNVDQLTLKAQFYKGSADLSGSARFAWEQLVSGIWTTVQAEATGSSGNTYTVDADDVAGSATFRCKCRTSTSSSVYFYDTMTVIDKTDNYQSNITSTAGDVFQNGVGDSVMIDRVWQNGEEVDAQKATTYASTPPSSPTTGTYYYHIIDPSTATEAGSAPNNPTLNQLWLDSSSTPKVLKRYNGTTWVAVTNVHETLLMRYNGSAWVDVTSDSTYGHTLTYTWYRLDIEGDPMDGGNAFATGKVIHVDSSDVEGKTTFVCEVSQSATLLSVAQFSIRDDSDITVADLAPSSPVLDQLWLKTSAVPNVLMRWDGTDWVTVNDTSGLAQDLADAVEDLEGQIDTAKTDVLGDVQYMISTMELTDDQFNVAFTRLVKDDIEDAIGAVQQNLEDYQASVTNYMRYDSNGVLTLGDTNSVFQTQLTNTKMSFLEGTSEIAYISNQSMYITTARITEVLSLLSLQ